MVTRKRVMILFGICLFLSVLFLCCLLFAYCFPEHATSSWPFAVFSVVFLGWAIFTSAYTAIITTCLIAPYLFPSRLTHPISFIDAAEKFGVLNAPAPWYFPGVAGMQVYRLPVRPDSDESEGLFCYKDPFYNWIHYPEFLKKLLATKGMIVFDRQETLEGAIKYHEGMLKLKEMLDKTKN